jgi:hypothetical protein
MPGRVTSFAALFFLASPLGAGCHTDRSMVQTPPPPGPDAPPPQPSAATPPPGPDAPPPQPSGTAAAPPGGAPPGNGSTPNTPKGCGADEPGKRYLGHSRDQCSRIRYFCEAGWGSFSDGCGCGCAKKP